MRISINIPRHFDPSDVVPLRRTYAFAEQLEQLGFYAAYCGHHSFTPDTGDLSAPFAFLSAVAARTERLRLGTGIYLAALHHPVDVCEQVSTLDQISGGRAILGCAVGYHEYEYAGFGLAYEERGSRLNETLEILRSAWATGRYNHAGRHFQLHDLAVHPLSVQQPRPPILVGGTSKAAIERAAKLGDGWFSLPMETLPVVKKLAAQYRDACARYGTEPYICLMREAWVAPTAAEVERDWLASALGFHKFYWEAGTKGDADDPVLQRVAAGEAVDYQTFARDRAIAGTPEFCVAEIQRWQAEVGIDELMIVDMTGRHGPAPLTSQEDMVELFGTEVLSAL